MPVCFFLSFLRYHAMLCYAKPAITAVIRRNPAATCGNRYFSLRLQYLCIVRNNKPFLLTIKTVTIMIRYKLYQDKRTNSSTKGKWYARAVNEETYDTERLAQHMAEHNTPYSAGVIKGVLTDMISCIKELMLDGKNVKLDNLAIFSVGLQSKGAPTLKDFSVNTNVRGVRLRARATGKLSVSKLKEEITLKEFTGYGVEGEKA